MSSVAPKHRVLIVDDEDYVRESLAEILGGEGYSVEQAASADEGLVRARERSPAVIVTDLRMPAKSGIEMISSLHAAGVRTPVIVITGAGSIQDAVQAMKVGAFDFLLKPVDPAQLVVQIERAIDHGLLVQEVDYLRRAKAGGATGRVLVGGSPPMVKIREAITKVAPTDVPVLLTGESGTGKEIAAEMVHRGSARRDSSLVTVNCAAIPATLFESECFGHVRGAFSGAHGDRVGRFEEAEKGTLFLDEIGTLDMDLQAKLLRVLETGEYQVVGDSRTRRANVRVIAATNENLQQRVDEGLFRADLYFRLGVFPIELPPLRDHREDIAEIAEELTRRAVRLRPEEVSGVGLDSAALRVLQGYHWPGNVRELRNVLERGMILSSGPPAGSPSAPSAALLSDILESSFRMTAQPSVASQQDLQQLNLRDNLEQLERRLVGTALEQASGKKKDAAALLGIDPRNLAYYLRKHQLAPDDGSSRG